MRDIVLLLRGHIRDSFKDSELFNFIKKLCSGYNVAIYIHTWTKYYSDSGWRRIVDDRNVRREDIISYFSGIKGNIKSIHIENENNIILIGNDAGNLFSTRITKISWKQMWYGIYSTMLEIRNDYGSSVNPPLVINMQFDVFNNYSSLINEIDLLEFIKHNVNTLSFANRFLRNSSNLIDIDNFYVGTVDSMYKLSYNFHNNLDHISELYANVYYEEVVVYYESNRLFGGARNNDNIELYVINGPSCDDNQDVEDGFNNIDNKTRFSIGYTNDSHVQRNEEKIGETLNLAHVNVKNPPFMKITPLPGVNWRGFGKASKKS
jgi:hypothetical protein